MCDLKTFTKLAYCKQDLVDWVWLFKTNVVVTKMGHFQTTKTVPFLTAKAPHIFSTKIKLMHLLLFALKG